MKVKFLFCFFSIFFFTTNLLACNIKKYTDFFNCSFEPIVDECLKYPSAWTPRQWENLTIHSQSKFLVFWANNCNDKFDLVFNMKPSIYVAWAQDENEIYKSKKAPSAIFIKLQNKTPAKEKALVNYLRETYGKGKANASSESLNSGKVDNQFIFFDNNRIAYSRGSMGNFLIYFNPDEKNELVKNIISGYRTGKKQL